MKKLLLTTCVVPIILGTLALSGCGKSEPSSGSGSGMKLRASANKNSFREVTSKLDAGGDIYLYLSTEQLVARLSEQVGSWREIVQALPELEAGQRQDIGRGFDIVTRVIKESGIEDFSGLGMSSIALETNFYRTTVFLHHYPEAGNGFLWNIGGSKAHPLTALDLLPANTALASFSDVDLPLLWSVIKKEVARSEFVEAKDFLAKVPTEFEQATGMNWEKTLNSLGGEFGLAITLDDSKKTSLPVPGMEEPLEIPGVGVVLAIKVNDDTIFNRIEQALTNTPINVERVDKNGLKMRTMVVPLPLPIALRPSIAANSGYIFIASTDTLIEEMLAVKAGQRPGLKGTDEFKRLSREIPTEGNRFTWLSERFGRNFSEIQERVVAARADLPPDQQKWLRSMLGGTHPAFCYSVTTTINEGSLTIANGNQNPGKVFLASAIAIPALAVLPAMALPAFTKARSTAKEHACMANLRTIAAAKNQWALENKKRDQDTPTEADIRKSLGGGDYPHCPEGGEYTIGKVGDSPSCSVHGDLK
jgi:hypothetical protein